MKKIYTKSVKFFAKGLNKARNSNKRLGYFERISDYGTLEGWAVDRGNSTNYAKVYVFVNNVLVSSAIANLYRGDLTEANVKKDGRAGFSIALEITKSNQALFKPGAKLDVAFDELNRQSLKGSGKLLSKPDVDAILSLDSNYTEALTAKIESVIASVKACDSLEDSDAFLATCKHTSLMLVRTAYQLYKLECYSQLLEFLNQVHNPKILRFCQLEYTLFRIIVLTESEQLSEQIIEQLDSAFYEHSNKKQQSVHFATYTDAAIIGLYALLQTKAVQLAHKKQPYSILLGKLVFVLGFWLYRCNANTHLSLNFLSLLQTIYPELLTAVKSQHLLAHLHRELNDNHTALAHCLSAIRQNTDYWWVCHEAAVLLGMLSNNHRMLFKSNLLIIEDYFHRAFLLNPYQSKSFREFEQALNHYFSSALSLSWQLAQAGFVDDALAERDGDLQQLTQIITHLYTGKFHQLNYAENSSKFRHNSLASKVIFVGSRELFQCYYYRVQQKLEQAQQIDLSTDYLDITELEQGNWQRLLMDVAVLYVCRIPATIDAIKLFCYAKGLGITIIYDIDDLIFDATAFPAVLETYSGTIDEKTHLHLRMDNPFFLNALKFADVCVASTQPLAMEISKHVKADVPVKVHPNVLSYDLYDLAQAYQAPPPKNSRASITIVYGSATKAHKQSFYEVFLPAVLDVLKKTTKVRLLLIGYFEGIPTQFGKQITILEPSSDFLAYINVLKKADINIAILEQSRLTDTKSEIKWLEAAVFEIPSIVTPTQAYRNVLTEGKDVLFATTQAEWQTQLLRLVENAELRKSIGKAAKKLAFDKFSPQIGENILKETVTTFIPNAIAAKKTKKRLLLVNVYCYPQSLGGGTRVFETQVQGLMEHYSEDYEIFVLTSDNDPDVKKSYYVEQYWFDNVLVTRLNVPPQDWTEHEDIKVYNFCLQFFNAYHFDIIHFHSIQVLTASVVDAAAALKIPYVITLHDAWWLSIYQFLVNPDGELVDHTLLLGGVAENNPKADWIVNRRRRLQKLMDNAKVVVAVSEKFAKLYQEAGVRKVQVHENYAEPFTRIEAPRLNSDKIILGFIGGISTHKGYDLLKTALETGHFANMQLIVINHSLQSGEVHYSQWGDTRVEFRAKAKQSEIAKLYAQFDVLIAPSIWPESYGLVTREALQAGLWVITSDRGAIGDCIIEGVNGNIVNVENHLGLLNALNLLPEQLKNRKHNENKTISPDVFVGETVENYLQQLVNIYQSALGGKN